MSKNTITKWLLNKNADGSLAIEPKEVNAFAPINRVLDRVGYFALDSVKVDNKEFLLVFEPEEKHETKSKLLVSRVCNKENGIIDMSDDDYAQVIEIAAQYMKVISISN